MPALPFTGRALAQCSTAMRARLFPACALAFLVAACSASNSVEVTAPTGLKCQVTVANQMQGSAPASGTSSTLDVTTTRDCTWTATSDQPWLTITNGANGQGSGTVSFSIAPNGQPAQRRATLDVNSSQVPVVQDAAPCQFDVTPANTSVSATGGTVTATVAVLPGCSWTVQTSTPWISITSATSGNGNGSVTLQVAANAGDGRTGTVTIAGKTVTIAQTPAACTYGISTTHLDVPFDGTTSGSITVTVRPGCTWTAASSVPWITVASGASGNGNGTVTVGVAVNPGDARSGTVSIAGQTATIAQAAAPCTFTLAPAGQNVPPEGGSGSVAVTVRAGCAWTAASGVPWVAITSAAGGNGNGTVTFTVAANPGAARSGTLTIAGKAFTVSQAAVPCTYAIAPTTQNIAGEGGTGTTNVTAGPTCAWTAVPNVPWISIVSGGSGMGSGTVAFAIAANPGPSARTGTLTIAGQTYTVTQSEPCSFSLAPSGQTFDAAGGMGTVAVTASAPTCGWGAASTAADWLVVLSAPIGNTGNGTVTYSVAPNTGPPRSAQIIIGLQHFDVTQGQP